MIQRILRSKWLLGAVTIVSAGHLVYFSTKICLWNYAALLILSGVVASLFSRNMNTILIFSLVITHLIWGTSRMTKKEGFTDNPIVVEAPEIESTQASNTTDEQPDKQAASSTDEQTTDNISEDVNTTAVERKLDDLQIKLDSLQTELSAIKTVAVP